jgi:hypothetical protein
MSFWNKFAGAKPNSPLTSERAASIAFSFEEEGVIYAPVTDADLADRGRANRTAMAYLNQLEQEGCITPLVEDWLLPWEQVYKLMQDPEHSTSLALLSLPPVTAITPVLASTGSLSDAAFKVVIHGWIDEHGELIGATLPRQGAVCTLRSEQLLLPESVWRLVSAVRDMHRAQQLAPGEKTNQLGWAAIRKLAKQANARMDGFLARTVVLRPDALKLNLKRQLIGDEQVIEVTPEFAEQPVGWLGSFDRLQQVPDRYVISDSDGGITHVLIMPEVKSILNEVRSMPGRRVSGEKASLFLKNPYAFLGAEAAEVLDPDEYDRSLEEAGIYFYHFSVQPQPAPDGTLASVHLILAAPSESVSPVILDLGDPITMARFVGEVGNNLIAELPCACWKGYELDLSGFGQKDLSDLERLQQRWAQQMAGQDLDGILDLDQYGDRVVGIGPAEKVVSQYLQKSSSENWLPENLLNELGMDGELLSKWDTSNQAHYEQFKGNIASAAVAGDLTARLPGPELEVELLTAQRIATVWGERFREVSERPPTKDAERNVLLVAGNIDEVDYGQSRGELIRLGLAANPDLPTSLLPTTMLREHQLKGVGWLQHLYGLSPHVTSGCILADDMGLGKTLQLLAFIAWYLENEPDGPPVLIVAPVSLLDNWEREMQHFLLPTVADEAFKLYGHALLHARTHKSEIPTAVRAHGIQNLLRFGWRQNKRVVLTTYETLRDQEFSLARQEWGIVICDEAQKIKNPAARVTQATKALKARFRIACTGTPVENSLTDLWCLYDWVQPGLLGSLNEFGRNFRRPIETRDEQGQAALDELRAIIEPQLLRRTKQEVAKELPQKIEDVGCKSLQMSDLQDRIYRSEIAGYHDKRQMQEHLGQQSAMMLGLLHTLKLICAHPHAVRPEGPALVASPKLRWTIQKLQAIKALGEKVIIFTELRDIQRTLQLAIVDEFGFRPEVINGDTNASGERGPTRQKLIDRFQEQPGFGVIILSTTAVGFGVNVQAANHVIHFTRPWNPAKEDQATDRAYRIGQERDVYVYYPTVVTDGITTFEQTLDQLLTRKRSLATDMLNGSGDIEIAEFSTSL